MNTTTAPTTARVCRVIAEHFGKPAADVTPEQSLVEDFDADSLDRVEVLMALEDEFGIEIADEDGARCKTVADWVAAVELELGR